MNATRDAWEGQAPLLVALSDFPSALSFSSCTIGSISHTRLFLYPMDEETLTVAAVQPPLRADDASPMEAAKFAERLMREAIHSTKVRSAIDKTGRKGVDLFVLPELSPIGYSEHTFANYLPGNAHGHTIEVINDEIEQLFSRFAREHGAFVCYGAVGKTREAIRDGTSKENLTIRHIVLSDEGEKIAVCNKIHLCNYGDCAETRFFSPGREPCSFECRGFRVGIVICADMRNPSLSRTLARDHRVDVILQPAAFSRDVSFRTWKSFRETRAVENSVYFVGVNYAGNNYGETSIIGPWVDECNEPDVLGTEPAVLVGILNKGTLRKVRKEFPYYGWLMRGVDAGDFTDARFS